MVFFHKKQQKIHPKLVADKKANAPVNTTGKKFFKNLRLRTKLLSKDVETPNVVKEKSGLVSRFRKFINFFKRGGKFRRSNRVASCIALPGSSTSRRALPTPVKSSPLTEPLTAVDVQDGEATVTYDDVETFSEDELCFPEDDINIEETSNEVAIKNVEKRKQQEFFENIEYKVSKSNKNKLPPIEDGEKKIMEVENVVFKEQFIGFSVVDRNIPVRAIGTRSRMANHGDSGICVSKNNILAKQIRAGEIRLDKNTEKLRPITQQRQRHAQVAANLQRIQTEKVEQVQAELLRRENNVSRNKQRLADDMAQRIQAQRTAWNQRHANQVVQVEQNRLEAQRKVEAKRMKTAHVAQRRDELINNLTAKLRTRHDRIAVENELRRAETPEPPKTPNGRHSAFESHQPQNEDDPLVNYDIDGSNIGRPGTPFPY